MLHYHHENDSLFRDGRQRCDTYNRYVGGYALCLLYIVMCAILRVAAYFLSVNLLHMYTVSVALCVAQHFPLKE